MNRSIRIRKLRSKDRGTTGVMRIRQVIPRKGRNRRPVKITRTRRRLSGRIGIRFSGSRERILMMSLKERMIRLKYVRKWRRRCARNTTLVSIGKLYV